MFIYEIKLDKEFDNINTIINNNNNLYDISITDISITDNTITDISITDNTITDNTITDNTIINEYTKHHILDFSDGIPPGLSITNNKGIGVKICKINTNDKFYKAGFHVDDVILFLDKVPCIYHSDSIKIIKYAYEKRKQLLVETLVVKK
jgi:hypothetical protein